ncbi:hypothetical protein [Desmospora profundinema]|uniref:Asparagine synthase n=1 Tax=Desmospora profundinema TaxID=1571184 RepID=A0ABU1IKJ9_9BACL|nr:hypothetical protein [Desmospora profundinema]MDR6225296.1 hypothetical protein [Desmospora profundinema]
MAKRGFWTVLIGLLVSLVGVSCLYGGERARSRHQMETCAGWGVLGFGVAHILMGSIAAVMGRER